VPAPRSMLYLLLGAAILKISLLLINGPSIYIFNSYQYIAYADAIVDHGRAFAPLDWGTEAVPPFVFRLPGYPLILAGAKLVSPTHYAFIAVIFQCVLSLTATYLIFRVSERLFQSSRAALWVAVLYIFSESILWDNSIMSDSIYASLFNIVIFGLIGHLIGCWRLTLAGGAGLAVLWGYSILTRDSGLYFTVFPIMLTIAIAIRSEDNFVFRIGHFLVFVLVTGGMLGAYVMLNRYRTGEAVFGITGLENWLRPVFDMARYRYAQPFTGDDLVSSTVRDTKLHDVTNYSFGAQLNFIRTLHDRCQCTPTQEQSLLFAKYLWAICHYPIAYLRVILRNLNYLDSLIADPVATINQFIILRTLGQTVPYSWHIVLDPTLSNVTKLAHNFSMTTFILLFVATIVKTVSTIALLLPVFGIPIILLSEWRAGKPMHDDLAVTSFLWLVFLTVSLAFSMVHIEPRHALPVLPAALVCLVYTLQWHNAMWRRGHFGPQGPCPNYVMKERVITILHN
jgi:hypothetical protein